MVERTPAKTVDRDEEFLKAAINYGGLKLNISTRNTAQSLSDLRRIVECMTSQEDQVEDFTTFEMGTLLSDEFVANNAAMKETRRLLGMEQQYRVVKETIGALEEIDLDEGVKHLRIEPSAIKQAISSLFSCVDTRATKHALIHIKGLLSEHERLVIIDRIHERIPHAQIRAYQTEQDIEGKVLIEALVFGDYEQDEVA